MPDLLHMVGQRIAYYECRTENQLLRTVTMFEDLTSDELADLVHIVTAYTFKPGAIIAYQRDVADKLYIVQQGRLEEYFVNEAGEVVEKIPFICPVPHFAMCG